MKPMTTKNTMVKSRTTETPYATFEGYGPLGDTTLHVLKSYSKPTIELKKPYARWFVAVKTDMTYGSYDLGDSYVSDCIRGLTLTFASNEFKENYWDSLEQLQDYSGFSFVNVVEDNYW